MKPTVVEVVQITRVIKPIGLVSQVITHYGEVVVQEVLGQAVAEQAILFRDNTEWEFLDKDIQAVMLLIRHHIVKVVEVVLALLELLLLEVHRTQQAMVAPVVLE
jgi:hypothetical protein